MADRSLFRRIFLFGMFCCIAFHATAIQRFPMPEFESGYQQPPTQQPAARALWMEWGDTAMLVCFLLLVSWLVLKRRSRRGVFFTSLAALLYFGFYRKGCICSIGAIQNVALALFDPAYAIPVTAILFFILPLVTTLFFGRTFCAGVCPFGALQDLVSFRPLEPGIRTRTVLGLVPYIYLGLAILFAATGSDFIICRYDPFVGIFRFDAPFTMFLFAGALLLAGVFIARPYCRFLCPYGVLLDWVSRLSWKHLTITPSKCIRCRLCEDSCPYGAIDMPVEEKNPETPAAVRRRMILAVALVPLFTLLGGVTVSQLHGTLAGVNPKVRLARSLEPATQPSSGPESFEITAYRTSGKPLQEVQDEAQAILRQFYFGGWILGGFLGLAFGLTLAGRLIHRHHDEYVPNRGKCFSCVRCVDYCPVDRELLNEISK